MGTCKLPSWDPIMRNFPFKHHWFWGEQGFSIGPILRQGWAAAAGATDRLTDTLYDYVPDGVSRAMVRTQSSGVCLCMSVSVQGSAILPFRDL